MSVFKKFLRVLIWWACIAALWSAYDFRAVVIAVVMAAASTLGVVDDFNLATPDKEDNENDEEA